jgi:hypothetical protein
MYSGVLRVQRIDPYRPFAEIQNRDAVTCCFKKAPRAIIRLINHLMTQPLKATVSSVTQVVKYVSFISLEFGQR